MLHNSFLIKNHWKTLGDIKFVVVVPDLIVWAFNSHKGVTEKEYSCSDENFITLLCYLWDSQSIP